MALEFIFLSGALYFYCGKQYLLNMMLTLALYTRYTNVESDSRISEIKEKMNVEKRQEIF